MNKKILFITLSFLILLIVSGCKSNTIKVDIFSSYPYDAGGDIKVDGEKVTGVYTVGGN